MSLRTVRMAITLPKYLADYVAELADELECSRSEIISESVLYVSKNEDDFLSQFEFDDEEEENEDEEEEF